MAGKRNDETYAGYKKRVIDVISDSYCAAKWLNATIWLGNGTTASCHHPPAHKIPLEEVAQNYKAIHNTNYKKLIRKQMLEGKPIDSCHKCKEMETHTKVSGRQKQLLKTGIRLENFVSTIKSSTFINEFEKSHQQNGDTDLMPQDWQIDLGNFCNSACSVFIIFFLIKNCVNYNS